MLVLLETALRGINCILIERRDITGAIIEITVYYIVVRDTLSMTKSLRKNDPRKYDLKRIARHCVEDTKGLFITLPEDDLNYQNFY